MEGVAGRGGRRAARFGWKAWLRRVDEGAGLEGVAGKMFWRARRARLFWKAWLKGLAERLGWKVWLEGVAERLGCEACLEGVAARRGWKVWLGVVAGPRSTGPRRQFSSFFLLKYSIRERAGVLEYY